MKCQNIHFPKNKKKITEISSKFTLSGALFNSSKALLLLHKLRYLYNYVIKFEHLIIMHVDVSKIPIEWQTIDKCQVLEALLVSLCH